MEPRGASDIDGQTERSIWAGAHESKCGQRTSFNGPEGISDVEGKVARVATSKLGNERVSNSTSANHTGVHRCLVVATGAVLLIGSKLATTTQCRRNLGSAGCQRCQPAGFGCYPKRTLIPV